MYIKDTLLENFGGFAIDADKINTSTSTKRDRIELVYTGPLPKTYESAVLFCRVKPENVRLVMVAKLGKAITKYIIEASREEIDTVLWPLFFRNEGGQHHTRMDNGLSPYWSGHYQAEFTAWHSIGQQPARIADMIRQLSEAQRASLYSTIEQMKQEAAG